MLLTCMQSHTRYTRPVVLFSRVEKDVCVWGLNNKIIDALHIGIIEHMPAPGHSAAAARSVMTHVQVAGVVLWDHTVEKT